MGEVHYLTADGAERLKNELEYLKGPSREQLAQRLRAAIQQGDLSENADYISAKEDQAFLEGRIQELSVILSNVQIIEEKVSSSGVVDIGSHVTIQEGDFEEETYYIVGPKEADPRNARISHESPIGRSLLNHRVGETVTAETPNGTIRFKIIRIE
ncbi:MAG: transcription elongation factor GreA [Anaerolineaceae bacterium]|nr:transcription elongation factor GreA [Anaerolineaceae bacterium]